MYVPQCNFGSMRTEPARNSFQSNEYIIHSRNIYGSAKGRRPIHVVLRSSSVSLGPINDRTIAIAIADTLNNSMLRETNVSTNRIWIKKADLLGSALASYIFQVSK